MSIRSTVGIALKNEVFYHLANAHPVAIDFLGDWCSHRLQNKAGVFFYLHKVNWSTDNALYEALKSIDDGDYLIREACHDYPMLDSAGNAGSWDDNPWKLSIRHEVSIGYEP